MWGIGNNSSHVWGIVTNSSHQWKRSTSFFIGVTNTYMSLRCCGRQDALLHEAEVLWTTWCTITWGWGVVDDLMHYYMGLSCCGRPDALLHEAEVLWTTWCTIPWGRGAVDDLMYYYMRRMTIEIVLWSISSKVRDMAGIKLAAHVAELLWKP